MAMVCADFTGGEAEELRRALGHKRSQKRMKEIEIKLRAGMSRKGIAGQAQDEIIKFITAFALYGFPESHSASFARIAYITAYLRMYYPAAYNAALLNNQPMGFYSPATLIQDAKRHGLKFCPIDVMESDWHCTLEHENYEISVRIGLRYIRGLSRKAGEMIVAQRNAQPFKSIADLCRRVPELDKAALRTLAQAGALNDVPDQSGRRINRRDALWQVQKYGGWKHHPLLHDVAGSDSYFPLEAMNTEERIVADYQTTGLTIGVHPMAHRRSEWASMGIKRAVDLANMRDGAFAIAAGQVDTRQRPGTAKGLMFMTLLDETGFANVVVMPDILQKYWMTACKENFVKVKGKVQNRDGVVHLRAEEIHPLSVSAAEIASHDFHNID